MAATLNGTPGGPWGAPVSSSIRSKSRGPAVFQVWEPVRASSIRLGTLLSRRAQAPAQYYSRRAQTPAVERKQRLSPWDDHNQRIVGAKCVQPPILGMRYKRKNVWSSTIIVQPKLLLLVWRSGPIIPGHKAILPPAPLQYMGGNKGSVIKCDISTLIQ